MTGSHAPAVSAGPRWGCAPQPEPPFHSCSCGLRLASVTHWRMAVASSLRASLTDVGSSGWDALRSRHTGRGALRGAGRQPHPQPTHIQHGTGPGQHPPRLGPHLRSRWCAPPWMVMARTDALRLLRICVSQAHAVWRALQASPPSSPLTRPSRGAQRPEAAWPGRSRRTGQASQRLGPVSQENQKGTGQDSKAQSPGADIGKGRVGSLSRSCKATRRTLRGHRPPLRRSRWISTPETHPATCPGVQVAVGEDDVAGCPEV